MLNINLEWDSNALAAPQSFRDGVQAAANILDAAIFDPITVNIEVGYGEYGENTPSAQSLPGGVSLGGVNNAVAISYSALDAALAAAETTAAGAAAVGLLPNTPSLAGQSTFYLPTALAKAFGALPANDPSIDGYVGFPTDFTGATLVDAAIVEELHALGLLNNSGDLGLFAYTSAGNNFIDTGSNPAKSAYFSLDGGKTDLANYSVGFDPTLFTNLPHDALDLPDQGASVLSALDLSEISAIGFDDTATPTLPAPTVTAGVTAAGTSPMIVGQNVSVPEAVPIAAASLIKSVSAPAAEPISSYGFYDTGSDGGYFSIGGVAQPDDAWTYVLDTQLDALQYVGGSWAGRETLFVEALADTGTGNIGTGGSAIATTLSPAAVISSYYQAILGRSADPAGLASFVSAVASGTGYAQVQGELAASPEAQADISGIYQGALGRPADPAGLANYTQFLANGGSLTAVQSSIAGSAEAAGDLDTIYRNALGRPIDSAGLTAWQGVLAQPGQSLTTVRTAIASSPEAAADLKTIYLNDLGRPADTAGLAAWQAVLAEPGQSLATVRNDFAYSQEAAGDLDTIYRNALGRPIDPTGVAAWQGVLAQAGQSLATVKAAIIGSPEAASDISGIYTKFGGTQSSPMLSADTADGRVQLNAGLTLGDLSYQIQFIDSSPLTTNVAASSTLIAAAVPELFQTNLAAVGQSIIANFSSNLDIIEISSSLTYSNILNNGQQSVAGFQINLGGGQSILLSSVNQSSLVPHDFRFV